MEVCMGNLHPAAIFGNAACTDEDTGAGRFCNVRGSIVRCPASSARAIVVSKDCRASRSPVTSSSFKLNTSLRQTTPIGLPCKRPYCGRTFAILRLRGAVQASFPCINRQVQSRSAPLNLGAPKLFEIRKERSVRRECDGAEGECHARSRACRSLTMRDYDPDVLRIWPV
jgi:hypothetical protein